MDQHKVKDEIINLEHEWAQAWQSSDVTTLQQILSDDFTLTSSRSDGELTTKEQYLDACKHLVRGSGYGFERLQVRSYGDVAIVNALFTQQATFGGKDWSGLFLLTDVWVSRDGSWQVVARHASRPTA